MSNVKVISKVPKFISASQAAMDKALNNAAVDIIRLSKAQVPHDSGNLQSSGLVERKGLMKYQVSYNSRGNAPYAHRWEWKTPPGGFKKGRKSHYLRDPGDEITRPSNMNKLYSEAFRSISI